MFVTDDWKRRIRVIQVRRHLNFAKKVTLPVTGIVALAVSIVVNVHATRAQSQETLAQSTVAPRFEAASIKPCKDMNEGGGRGGGDRGRLVLSCRPLMMLIDSAY